MFDLEDVDMNSRYAIGIHVLSLISLYPESARTSEDIAVSVGTNPVIVRKVISQLRRAGLLSTQQGVPGATLTKAPGDITLLDIYQAVDAPDSVFNIHGNSHPACPVGGHIHATLEGVFSGAQQAMEACLSRVRLTDVMQDLQHRGR